MAVFITLSIYRIIIILSLDSVFDLVLKQSQKITLMLYPYQLELQPNKVSSIAFNPYYLNF
jgi:hypothetical protein